MPDGTIEQYTTSRISDFVQLFVDDWDVDSKPIMPIDYAYRNGVVKYVALHEVALASTRSIDVAEVINVALFADYIQDLYSPALHSVFARLTDLIARVETDSSVGLFDGIELTPSIISRMQKINVSAISAAVRLGRINPGWVHTLEDPLYINVYDSFGLYCFTQRNTKYLPTTRMILTQSDIELFTSINSLTAIWHRISLDFCENTLQHLTTNMPTHVRGPGLSISNNLLNNLLTLTNYDDHYNMRDSADPAICQLREVVAPEKFLATLFRYDRSYPSVETIHSLKNFSSYISDLTDRPLLSTPIMTYFPNLVNLTIQAEIMILPGDAGQSNLLTLVGSSIRNLRITLGTYVSSYARCGLWLKFRSSITQEDVAKIIRIPNCEPIDELYGLNLHGVNEKISEYIAIAPNLRMLKTDCEKYPVGFKFPARLHYLGIRPFDQGVEIYSLLRELKTIELFEAFSGIREFNRYAFNDSIETIIDNISIVGDGAAIFTNTPNLKRVELRRNDTNRKADADHRAQKHHKYYDYPTGVRECLYATPSRIILGGRKYSAVEGSFGDMRD